MVLNIQYQKEPLIDQALPHPAVFWIFTSSLIIMSLAIIAGILAILKVQIINFFTGQTTNERFSTQKEQKHVSNFQPNRADVRLGDSNKNGNLSHSQMRIEKSLHTNDNVQIRETKRISEA